MEFFPAFGLLFAVLPVALIVLAIVAVAGRREPDPRGARLYVFYLSAVTFVALFVVLFSLFAMTSALARLGFERDSASDVARFGTPALQEEVDFGVRGEDDFGPGFEDEETAEVFEHGGPELTLFDAPGPHIRDALLPAIVGLLGALVLVFHARRLRAATRAPDFAAGGSLRTFLAYLYAVCFASVVIALGAAAAALYALVRAAFPDAGGFPPDVERDRAWADLVSGSVLAILSGGVFAFHWRRSAALRGEPSDRAEAAGEGA